TLGSCRRECRCAWKGAATRLPAPPSPSPSRIRGAGMGSFPVRASHRATYAMQVDASDEPRGVWASAQEAAVCFSLLFLLRSRSADCAAGEMPYWSAERGRDATLIGRWGVFETGALIPRADGGSIRRERSSVRWTAGSSV